MSDALCDFAPCRHPLHFFEFRNVFNDNDICPDTAWPGECNRMQYKLPTPISKERAMEVAVEQYGFCPDLDQNEDGSIGSLADVLWQSTVWYFWWD